MNQQIKTLRDQFMVRKSNMTDQVSTLEVLRDEVSKALFSYKIRDDFNNAIVVLPKVGSSCEWISNIVMLLTCYCVVICQCKD